MKKSVTAALISGLVFPGIGHLYLKHYRNGCLLLLVATLALVELISVALRQAQAIADKVLSGEIALDPAAISAQVEATERSAATPLHSIAYAVLIVCWSIGIVDAYRLGRKLEPSVNIAN